MFGEFILYIKLSALRAVVVFKFYFVSLLYIKLSALRAVVVFKFYFVSLLYIKLIKQECAERKVSKGDK